jgi:uncharacterized protein
VILVDANLLLYAYNESFPEHLAARRWLEAVLSRPERVCLAWTVILAFLRIGTNPRAFEHPFSIVEAVEIAATWLTHPSVAVLDPGERHWEILARLLSVSRARGPVVMDAHLAALAIEHGAVLCTTDRDFARFPDVRVVDPLDASR